MARLTNDQRKLVLKHIFRESIEDSDELMECILNHINSQAKIKGDPMQNKESSGAETTAKEKVLRDHGEMVDEMLDKVELMEQFAEGILEAFNRLNQKVKRLSKTKRKKK